ncbi:MAG: hypothetical protein OTI36_17745, partial [Beijerinckiaceae bacterium]|nr:hypothetical protein [Beijerinckiaceae bacterium]
GGRRRRRGAARCRAPASRRRRAAGRLASAMGARYIPLPYADAQGVSRAVMAATPSAATLRAGNI